MTSFQVLFLSILLVISYVFSASIQNDSSKKLFIYNPEKDSLDICIEPTIEDKVGFVPPPPGSELMKTRKRTNSFHKSADQMNKLDTREVFENPERYECLDYFDERHDSNCSTDEENWKGFIMDYKGIYPSPTRSNSSDSGNQPSILAVNQRKSFFSQSKSKSFKASARKKTPVLSTFSESEEDNDDYGAV